MERALRPYGSLHKKQPASRGIYNGAEQPNLLQYDRTWTYRAVEQGQEIKNT